MTISLKSFNNYTLFLDTTNNFCYAAIYKSDMLINEIKIPVNKNVTDIIVDAINTLLINSNIKQEDLTHMCVNIGPGSFTGVKVGVVIAKAWRLVNPKLEIRSITSLLLQCKSLPALSIIDAKSNKFYVAAYNSVGKEVYAPACVDVLELDKIKKQFNDYQIYQDQIDDMYDNYAKHIASMPVVKDIQNFDPLYLKKPV